MHPDNAYVYLERRFTDVHDEPSSAWTRRAFGRAIGKTWDDLVPQQPPVGDDRSAVIVLAPSGLGKSSEMVAHAARLNSSGVVAFYMRAVDLAGHGVAASIPDAAAFQAWQSSSVEAVFFIDAVDEARLVGHDLERVMLRFARDIDPVTRKLRLVLSSRNDVWAAGEVRHVIRALALPTSPAVESTPAAPVRAPVRIVRLEPLCKDHVKVFARASGVIDTDAFMAAFAEEEIEPLFELRPPDVRVLVGYWKNHGAFGSWSEMLEASVEASVRNENRQHAFHQQFTYEDAKKALARLGAATVLGKKSLISQSGFAGPGEVNADRLFRDSRPVSVAQLLAMGLFTQKGYHAVQLPQGPPSHYLTAVWLGERARNGWDLRALEDVLFIKPFGTGAVIAPPSRSPVIGWVAGFVPALRRRLLQDLPQVLLFEGDPARLSRGECIEALRRVLSDLRNGRHDASPTTGTLRQLAKHDIAGEIARLLDEFADVPPATRLLLRLATAGRLEEAAERALSIALAPSTGEHDRVAAIRAVAVTGGEALHQQLLVLVTHASEWVRLALVQELAPRTLNGQVLRDLVLATTDRSVAHLLGYALSEVALDDIDAILQTALPIVSVEIGKPVAPQAEPQLEICSRLAAVRLRRGGAAPAWMADVILALENHVAGPFFVDGEVLDEINSVLAADRDLRRAVWRSRMAAEKGNRLFDARLGPARAEDLQWFWQLREEVADEQVKFGLRWPLDGSLRAVAPQDRAALLGASTTDPNLRAYVEQWEAEGAHAAAREREQRAKQLAEQAALRAKNIEEIQPNRERIEAGEDANALLWAWNMPDRLSPGCTEREGDALAGA